MAPGGPNRLTRWWISFRFQRTTSGSGAATPSQVTRCSPTGRWPVRLLERLISGAPTAGIGASPWSICLEGGWTAFFAQAGLSCLGIEGRQANFDRCELVERELGLGSKLPFVRDDVREPERYGPFDVTFCAGILYHLDRPVSFLVTVAHSTKRLLILDTHYAMDSLPISYPSDPDRAPDLSEVTTHEGVHGRWYQEHLEGETEAQIRDGLWASLDNRRSFWIDRRDLIATLIRLGFSPVYEQLDYHPRLESGRPSTTGAPLWSPSRPTAPPPNARLDPSTGSRRPIWWRSDCVRTVPRAFGAPAVCWVRNTKVMGQTCVCPGGAGLGGITVRT